MQVSNPNYESLQKYLPLGAVQILTPYFNKYPLKITLWNHRRTKHGDYKMPMVNGIHKISINRSLNPYFFLLTMIHELSHQEAFVLFGRKEKAHGSKWKNVFSDMLAEITSQIELPHEVRTAFLDHSKQPRATSGSDKNLVKVLSSFDTEKKIFLEDLPEKAIFRLENGMTFIKGAKRRSRFTCKNIGNNKTYYVNGMAPVYTD